MRSWPFATASGEYAPNDAGALCAGIQSMKTVANLEELRRLAAASGGTAVVGGQTINAQGARMRMFKPAAETAPVPAPAPTATPQAVFDHRPLLLAIEQMGITLGRTLGEAMRQPRQVDDAKKEAAVAAEPVANVSVRIVRGGDRPTAAVFTAGARSCEYKFVRGKSGVTTALVASAPGWPLVNVDRDKAGNMVGMTTVNQESVHVPQAPIR